MGRLISRRVTIGVTVGGDGGPEVGGDQDVRQLYPLGREDVGHHGPFVMLV